MRLVAHCSVDTVNDTVNRKQPNMSKARKHPLPDLVTQSAAAKIIGVSRQAVHAMVFRGQIEAVTVAGVPYIVKASAHKVADERRAAGRLAA